MGNGNLIGASGASFTYDAQNRLTQATVGNATTTFAYDPRNRLVQRTINRTLTNLTYDDCNLIEERVGAGAGVLGAIALIPTPASPFVGGMGLIFGGIAGIAWFIENIQPSCP